MAIEEFFLAHARISTKDHRRITLEDKVTFLQQFATLTSSRTPLPQALKITAQQSRSVEMRRILEEIAARVAEGYPISSVLPDYRNVFEDRWIKLIGMGEASGKMEVVLSDLNREIRESCEARRRIARALRRLVTLLSIAALTGVLMVWIVIPTVNGMFNEITSQLREAIPSLDLPTSESITGPNPLQQFFEASQTVSREVPGRKALASGRNPNDRLSNLTLSATYVQGKRRFALIDAQIYEQGQLLAISESLKEPCFVAEISADKVLIRHGDRTVELKYGRPTFSADSPSGLVERPLLPTRATPASKAASSTTIPHDALPSIVRQLLEKNDLKQDALRSVLLQQEETDNGH